MPQKAFPRSHQLHAAMAGKVIARHESTTGRAVALPVPVELIVEATYGIEVLWEEIEETTDLIILGALIPSQKRIVMNSLHDDLFGTVIGPERFTLAHELGHWIYDADSPDQLSLEFDVGDTVCYELRTVTSDDARIREVNANNFASHLLMPEHLVRAAGLEAVLGSPRRTAREWGVSQEALAYRLERLGLLGGPGMPQLRFDR